MHVLERLQFKSGDALPDARSLHIKSYAALPNIQEIQTPLNTPSKMLNMPILKIRL